MLDNRKNYHSCPRQQPSDNDCHFFARRTRLRTKNSSQRLRRRHDIWSTTKSFSENCSFGLLAVSQTLHTFRSSKNVQVFHECSHFNMTDIISLRQFPWEHWTTHRCPCFIFFKQILANVLLVKCRDYFSEKMSRSRAGWRPRMKLSMSVAIFRPEWRLLDLLLFGFRFQH